MGKISCHMRFLWFVGLAGRCGLDHLTFGKNCNQLVEQAHIVHLFDGTVETAHAHAHPSGEHLSLDGALFQAYTSNTSFVRKSQSDGDLSPNGATCPRESWHGETRSDQTTYRARLFCKRRRTRALLC